jgi:hypothetical protein
MAKKGWSRKFEDPIPLPDGGQLKTLRDAGHYIAKLPKREHDAPEWQAAMRALMLVVEKGGPTMLPQIGMMRALTVTSSACSPTGKNRVGDVRRGQRWCC